MNVLRSSTVSDLSSPDYMQSRCICMESHLRDGETSDRCVERPFQRVADNAVILRVGAGPGIVLL